MYSNRNARIVQAPICCNWSLACTPAVDEEVSVRGVDTEAVLQKQSENASILLPAIFVALRQGYRTKDSQNATHPKPPHPRTPFKRGSSSQFANKSGQDGVGVPVATPEPPLLFLLSFDFPLPPGLGLFVFLASFAERTSTAFVFNGASVGGFRATGGTLGTASLSLRPVDAKWKFPGAPVIGISSM